MWCVWFPVAFSISGHWMLSVPSVLYVFYRVQKSMHQLTPGTCREAVWVPLPSASATLWLPLDSAAWAYSHFRLAFPPNWLLDASWLLGLSVRWPSISAKRMVHRVNAPASETQTTTNHSCFIILQYNDGTSTYTCRFAYFLLPKLCVPHVHIFEHWWLNIVLHMVKKKKVMKLILPLTYT